jgi:phosphoglycolate phosphatase
MLTGAVFDFDGTLAELHIDFIRLKHQLAAIAAAFLDAEPQEVALPALEYVEHVHRCLEQRSLSAAREFHSRCRLLITATEMDAARKGRLFPETLPLLNGLKQQSIRTGIITRNCSAAVSLVAPEIKIWCDAFLPREDVAQVKPHPEHLLTALRAMGVPAAGSLMVGDHPLDIQTARRAGCMSAVVCTGHTSLEALQAESPDILAEDLRDLMAQLAAKGLLPRLPSS